MGLCQPFALQGAMAARPVGRPWSSSGGDDDVCFHRTALVLALRSGLLQKGLLEFAWDVQTTVEEMGKLVCASSVEELIGGSLVLARQVYASAAQQQVASMAMELSGVQGRVWCSKSLRVLHSRLRCLTPRDSRKCRGRNDGVVELLLFLKEELRTRNVDWVLESQSRKLGPLCLR